MNWLPYPENIPDSDGEYLVSSSSYVQICRFISMYKQYNEHGDKFYGPAWVDEGFGCIDKNIKAFMNKPKVFQLELL
jgi:hypothetical protein